MLVVASLALLAQHAAQFVSWNECGSQTANLGTEHATADECAAAELRRGFLDESLPNWKAGF